MRSLVVNFDTTENFWDCNRHFLAVKDFHNLYSKDKSKSRKTSSDIMWAVSIMMDQHQNNPLRNVNYNDKLTLVREDFFEIFDENKHGHLLDLYKRLCLTQIERSIYDLGQKLDERDHLLMNTQYTLDNAKELDTLISNTKKLKELYDGMVQELEKQEAGGGQTRGGRVESASEKGEL